MCKLNSENEHLVLKNMKLVYYIVEKVFNFNPNSSDFEDIVSIATIGLIKSVITFNPSMNNTFSTYASRCISNEILMNFRNKRKHAKNISIDEVIGYDGSGNELTLGERLEHPESNFVEKIVNKNTFISLISIVLNCLTGRSRMITLYRIGKVAQCEIAEKLNISRSYVSRYESKAKKKIHEIFNQKNNYKEVFSMAIVGDEYKITFASKDIEQFNKIFATLLKNLKTADNLPNFKVNCNSERIVIQVPAHPESFAFVAEIIQNIDDFSISFVSNKDLSDKIERIGSEKSVPKIQTVEPESEEEKEEVRSAEDEAGKVQNVEVEEVPEKFRDSDEIGTELIQNDSKETSEAKVLKREKTISHSKLIREYIETLEEFNVKELQKKFSNVNKAIISNVLNIAKKNGLISNVARGCYVVNKK